MINGKIILALLFLLLLLLVSCNTNNRTIPLITSVNSNSAFIYTDSDDIPLTTNYNAINGISKLQYSDGYLYFNNCFAANMMNLSENRTLMRYNVKAGTLTSVCTDPLCKHNTIECPFYAMYDTFYINNNNILFAQVYYETKYENTNMRGFFKMYNLKTGITLNRNEIDTRNYSEFPKQLVFENYVFYYDYVYDKVLDEWFFDVCRWNMVNNTVTNLNAYNGTDDQDSQYSVVLAYCFLFAKDSRIYFTDGKSIFSTDIYLKDKEELTSIQYLSEAFTDGEYIYYGVLTDSNTGVESIYRMNMDGSGDINLGILCGGGSLVITTEYLYYKNGDQISIGKCRVKGASADEVILQDSEIWRCRHDGTGKEPVYKFENEYEYHRILYECYVGNYIYALYNYWIDPNNDGIFEDGDYYFSAGSSDRYNIMRIDMKTKKTTIINGIN